VRLRPNGRKEFYFRERRDGRSHLVKIGRFAQTPGDGGMSVAEARSKWRELSTLHKEGSVKELLSLRRAETMKAAIAYSAVGSFGDLLDAYVADLKSRGRMRVRDVENMFRLYVRESFPTLISRKANEISGEDIRNILGRMVEKGLTRAVNHLRGYLRAAFAYGAKAEFDPRRGSDTPVRFALASNPVALIPVISEYVREGDRVLSETDLRAFWMALDGENIVVRQTIRLAVALGGQRFHQLIRARWDDFDLDQSLLRLIDTKGRGSVAREHWLPLPRFVRDQLKPLIPLNRENESPFSSLTRPGVRVRVETLSSAVSAISKDLNAKHQIEPFRMGDLRRTCETMLAALGVSKQDRCELQSHGLSGVQKRHYDRHTYLDEKKAALEKWHRKLRAVLAGNACATTPVSKRLRKSISSPSLRRS
jgi:integrase